MIGKCDSYHTRQGLRYISQTPTYENIPECWGTKERDVCDCGGDRMCCDFYPEVREKANSEIERIKISDDAIDEGILYLRNALDMLYEYGKIKNIDVICEVSVIDTIIGRLQNEKQTQ